MAYKKLPTIKMESYNYSIEGEKDEYYLYVICNNSAGMYEVRKKLTETELKILLYSDQKLTELVKIMRENPSDYSFSY